jgi:hypothetical protein
MPTPWKTGRGKLGFLDPLLGQWVAAADTPMGPLECTRSFERALGDAYVQLRAVWRIPAAAKARDDPKVAALKKRGPYQETALFGVGDGGRVAFWSFTSDGKRSQGAVADVTDLHPQAVGFEAQMPAGLARQAYWPDEDGAGFYWVVESKTAKGWRRFTHHHYLPA